MTLCHGCHNKFDFGDGPTMETYGEIIRNYLKSKYEDWNEDDLVYKKYGGIFDD